MFIAIAVFLMSLNSSFAEDCDKALSTPVAFGNFRLEFLSTEFAGLVDSWSRSTGRVMYGPGQVAIVLAQKGVRFQFETSSGWHRGRDILISQINRKAVPALRESDVLDIRLAPAEYLFWSEYLRKFQYIMKDQRDQKSDTQLDQVMASFSRPQMEAILMAYLSGGGHTEENLYSLELTTKMNILRAGGFSDFQARIIAQRFMEDWYDSYELRSHLRRQKRLSEEVRNKMWLSSRLSVDPPKPLPLP